MSDGSTPVFLQGPFEFEGNGLDKPALIARIVEHLDWRRERLSAEDPPPT